MDPEPSVLNILLTVTQPEPVSLPLLLLTAFLVFLNGFFVAAEFAIVKVRASQIEIHTKQKKRIGAISKSIINNLDSYLAATQLGITLASLGLGWIGESALTPIIIKVLGWFGMEGGDSYLLAQKIALPTAFVIITFVHIVFGELAPKSLAIRKSTSTTFFVAVPLKIFHWIFSPVIWFMNGFANLILKLIGIDLVHGPNIHTEEELKYIISESQEGGAIEETESSLIQNVFEFDDRRVSHIQTQRKNVVAFDINTSVVEALRIAIEEGYSRYPVYEDGLGNIKGILYTKDLISYMMNNKTNKRIRGLIRNPEFVSENAKIKHVLKTFQKKRIQMAIVTDEVGELSGIVTMEDILEELVGEIQDEYDDEEPAVIQVKNNIFIVNAHTNLSDINKDIPYELEESDDYDTLAGLIAEINQGEELKAGDIVELTNYTAKILKMYRNSVERVELTVNIVEPEDDADDE